MEPEFDREKEIKNLLNHLRTKMGFIITNNQEMSIISTDPLFAEEFVEKVFAAENMNPQFYLKLSKKVKRNFTDRFGNQV